MKKKIVWMLVSCLMVLSLVIASCGPKEAAKEEEIGKATVVTAEEEKAAEEEVAVEEEGILPPEVPKYGGTLVSLGGDFGPIDPTKAQAIRVGHMMWTSSELMQGDWTKGPQGTGETMWDWGFLGDITLEAGELAESWELPDDTTIIYHLRHGIRYQNKPPANGRELTADDVVWNIHYQFNYPGCWETMSYPPTKPDYVTDRMLPGDPRRPTSVKALDKYTVQVKVPAASQAIMLLEIGDNLYTNPPECWTTGKGWTDWRDVVGSGPFILTDYVPSSLIVYTKHPNYFENDPLHPENRLPYIDTLRLLIIPDASTQLAAFRTGRIDMMQGVTWENAKLLREQCPEVKWYKRLGNASIAAGRMDKADLPFRHLKVRQAMNMAINKEAFLNEYLKGEGAMLTYPFTPTKGFEKFYTPLEEMPEEVQMLFRYDPARARELLKEAGYPNGFKTTIYCSSTAVDELSMFKAWLADVNITMEIKPLDFGAWFGMWAARSYEEMFYGPLTGLWAPFEQLCTKTGMYSNIAYIDDPYFAEVGTVIGRDMVKNPENYYKTMREAAVYELSLAWGIFMPGRYSYNMWWPWVQNWYGVSWAGWANTNDLFKYYWIDPALKKSMGY